MVYQFTIVNTTVLSTVLDKVICLHYFNFYITTETIELPQTKYFKYFTIVWFKNTN